MTDETQIANYGDYVSVYRSESAPGQRAPDNETGSSEEAPQKVRYWVDTPKNHYVFTNEELVPADRTRRRALAWAAITSETGCRDDEADRGYVPVNIGAHGKPYIAAYLFAIHDQSIEQIAQEMDLTNSTISQYVSDIVSGRR
ncbi:hypothetical protein [Halorubrum salsamenti]|uniref:hypothetical protein n=1 Tax=Halorubrum salsamenti TaxID=2583990 RepID=UPI0011A6196F|nr:hypothetical protein [Halorubrum salsamenti]